MYTRINHRSSLLLALAVFFLPFYTYSQVYVTQFGAGAQNGSGWANAYAATQLRQALLSSPTGTQVWVALGTYKPHSTSRDSSFFIPSGVRVYGGFAGTETSLSQRNWQSHTTIFSGDINVPGDSTDNSYHVVRFLNADSTTLLDGVTITGGNANGAAIDQGGGISSHVNFHFGAPRIKHCKLLHNTAALGGAIGVTTELKRFSLCIIDSCTFAYNHNTAVAYVNRMRIDNSNFNNNDGFEGGALHGYNMADKMYAVIRHCNFTANTATRGGAFFVSVDRDASLQPQPEFGLAIDSCSFTGNHASNWGGALYVRPDDAVNPYISISNSTFDENEGAYANAAYYGNVAGLHTSRSHCYIYNNSFTKNYGGDAALVVDVEGSLATDTTLIANCTFFDNKGAGAGYCSALRCQAGSQTRFYTNIVNNTFYSDFAASMSAASGGVIQNITMGGTPDAMIVNIDNCIVWYEGTYSFLNSIMNGFGGSGNFSNATVNIRNSLVRKCGAGAAWNNSYGNNMGGNLDTYPMLADTNYATPDMRLRCNSPAVNAGSNTFLSLLGTVNNKDLDGHPRVLQSIIDMGAYENNMTPPVAIPDSTVSNSTINVQDMSTGIIDSLRWDFGDGSQATTGTASHTYTANGTYTVCLHLFSSCGNIDSCFKVKIETGGSGTGINNITPAMYTVSPNPATSHIQVTGLPVGTVLQLTDLQGRVLQHTRSSGPVTVLQVATLPAGMYLLHAATPGGGLQKTWRVAIAKE